MVFAVVLALFLPQTATSYTQLSWNHLQVTLQNTCNQPMSAEGVADLKQLLQTAKLAAMGNERLILFAEQTAIAYGPNPECLLWIHDGEPTIQASQLLQKLKDAAEKGLEPSDYDGHIGTLDASSIERPLSHSEASLVRFDVGLTVAAIRYISDLHNGRANPDATSFPVVAQGRQLELGTFVEQYVTNTSDMATELEGIEPPFQGYRRTLSALAQYRRLSREFDVSNLPIPPNPVEPGIPYKGAAELRRRLQLVGDLDDSSPHDPMLYDVGLAEAVIRFQQRHGLEPNGRLDGATIRELNTPLEKRIKQLELTLERWRWLSPFYSGAPIVVNIPEFRLHIVDEEHHVAASMNVVVGRAYHHETPIFQGAINSVLFRPPWNVPIEIQRKELVPLIEEDPEYLEKNSYDVVDGSGLVVGDSLTQEEVIAGLKAAKLFLRQRPGDDNSLGLIKFDLPNPYNIYLHGTPAQDLFLKARRDFSHGCVRVEDPVALAVWLLRANPGWSRDRIETMMQGAETVRVALTKPVPIWIVYGTAVVLEDGRVRFFRDIYGQDAELEEELAKQRREERLAP